MFSYKILWAEQQFVKQRSKRGFWTFFQKKLKELGTGYTDDVLIRVKRNSKSDNPNENKTKKSDHNSKSEKIDIEKHFNDEYWNHQWYLVRIISLFLCYPGHFSQFSVKF